MIRKFKNKTCSSLLKRALKELSLLLDATFPAGSRDDSDSNDPTLYVIDYVYFFLQGLEAEITDRHPFLVEAFDQVQPITETFMLTFANLTQARSEKQQEFSRFNILLRVEYIFIG